MQHNQLLLLAVPAISAAGSTDNGSISLNLQEDTRPYAENAGLSE